MNFNIFKLASCAVGIFTGYREYKKYKPGRTSLIMSVILGGAYSFFTYQTSTVTYRIYTYISQKENISKWLKDSANEFIKDYEPMSAIELDFERRKSNAEFHRSQERLRHPSDRRSSNIRLGDEWMAY